MLSALLCAVVAVPTAPDPNAVRLRIDVDGRKTPISRLVYGANDGAPFDLAWGLYRLGGNAATPYNWENNFDNAGKDWQHSSGYGWTMRLTPESRRNEPAAAIKHHHEHAQRLGAETMVQVNVLGWVAADGNGPVSEAEKAPSPRWKKLIAKKPSAFADMPDLNDDSVYVDEMVAHLVKRYGPASSNTGIKAYSLDNEPGLWPETHPRMFPQKLKAQYLVEKSIETAKAIKAVDPSARIHGPNCFGVYEYMHLINAPDWPEIQKAGKYEWFIDYYLDAFRKASEEAGIRLLDVLDVHFYVEGAMKTESGISGIQQAPRAFWDRSHREGTWLGEVYPSFFPVIPRLKQSIAKYNPGTKLCFSEWNGQDPNTQHGAIASADILGAFGRYGVDMATWWDLIPHGADPNSVPWARSSQAIYLDFDGKGGRFGDQSIAVANPKVQDLSTYAALDSKTGNLHVILLSKRRHVPLQVEFSVPKDRYSKVRAYGFGSADGDTLKPIQRARFDGTSVTIEMPKYSAAHLVLSK